MLYIIFIAIAITAGGYFAFRYFSVILALKEITKELDDIQQDLTQNQILHLPTPNRHLERLLCSVNAALEGIQEERRNYEKREMEFQKQIENISHDLRTPLTVISGYLKLIRQSDDYQLKDHENLAETIDIIERKADAMKHLVSQFYDYSRLNAGDYEISLEKTDLSRILRESLMGNYQILEQAHLTVHIDLPQRPLWVLGETSSLERIFLNLLQNAGRYADTCLNISVKEQENIISVFFINDTHILSEEDIPHLFDRFYMQDGSRSQGGTGLGLTVARALAEEMGASLSADIAHEHSEKENLTVCFKLCLKAFS